MTSTQTTQIIYALPVTAQEKASTKALDAQNVKVPKNANLNYCSAF